MIELLSDLSIVCDSCADCPYAKGGDQPSMAMTLRATAERLSVLNMMIINRDQIIRLLEGDR
jgi:hypothetical protein